MRGLIRELDFLMTDTDAGRLRLGLKLPARLPMPQPVEQVKLEATSQGKVFV